MVKLIVHVILTILLVYLCTSFIAWDFHPQNWIMPERAFLVACTTFAIIAVVISKNGGK